MNRNENALDSYTLANGSNSKEALSRPPQQKFVKDSRLQKSIPEQFERQGPSEPVQHNLQFVPNSNSAVMNRRNQQQLSHFQAKNNKMVQSQHAPQSLRVKESHTSKTSEDCTAFSGGPLVDPNSIEPSKITIGDTSEGIHAQVKLNQIRITGNAEKLNLKKAALNHNLMPSRQFRQGIVRTEPNAQYSFEEDSTQPVHYMSEKIEKTIQKFSKKAILVNNKNVSNNGQFPKKPANLNKSLIEKSPYSQLHPYSQQNGQKYNNYGPSQFNGVSKQDRSFDLKRMNYFNDLFQEQDQNFNVHQNSRNAPLNTSKDNMQINNYISSGAILQQPKETQPMPDKLQSNLGVLAPPSHQGANFQSHSAVPSFKMQQQLGQNQNFQQYNSQNIIPTAKSERDLNMQPMQFQARISTSVAPAKFNSATKPSRNPILETNAHTTGINNPNNIHPFNGPKLHLFKKGSRRIKTSSATRSLQPSNIYATNGQPGVPNMVNSVYQNNIEQINEKYSINIINQINDVYSGQANVLMPFYKSPQVPKNLYLIGQNQPYVLLMNKEQEADPMQVAGHMENPEIQGYHNARPQFQLLQQTPGMRIPNGPQTIDHSNDGLYVNPEGYTVSIQGVQQKYRPNTTNLDQLNSQQHSQGSFVGNDSVQQLQPPMNSNPSEMRQSRSNLKYQVIIHHQDTFGNSPKENYDAPSQQQNNKNQQLSVPAVAVNGAEVLNGFISSFYNNERPPSGKERKSERESSKGSNRGPKVLNNPELAEQEYNKFLEDSVDDSKPSYYFNMDQEKVVSPPVESCAMTPCFIHTPNRTNGGNVGEDDDSESGCPKQGFFAPDKELAIGGKKSKGQSPLEVPESSYSSLVKLKAQQITQPPAEKSRTIEEEDDEYDTDNPLVNSGSGPNQKVALKLNVHKNKTGYKRPLSRNHPMLARINQQNPQQKQQWHTTNGAMGMGLGPKAGTASGPRTSKGLLPAGGLIREEYNE